jgi:predicted P-loop ATPase
VKIEIATGGSRKTKVWQNKSLTWAEFADKLRTPIITSETMAEYETMPKKSRDEIKDVGGFVGGYLEGGSRKRGSCKRRYLITLDADTASKDFIEMQKLIGDYEGVIYSTHSYTAEKPKLRLVAPLSRAVTGEEYTPLALKFAEELGLKNFDPTTYEPERLMYYPSCSKDAEYIYERLEGKPLDPDKFLSRYKDWRDIRQWADTGIKQHVLGHKKLTDPREKSGLVGAFCRVYPIKTAIEKFLSDVYKRGSIEERYTLIGASTTNGLVLYDNGLHAFSHHSTDPICGKCVNAFDLVRLHKYKDKDKGISPDTPIGRLPSYIAMKDLACEDEDVKKELIQKDFGIVTQDKTVKNKLPKGIEKLTIARNGRIEPTIANVVLLMEHEMKGYPARDEFTDMIIVKGGDLPWRKKSENTPWGDEDDSNLREWLETKFNVSHVRKVQDAVTIITAKHAFHPVRKYLNNLKWDGVKRVETLLIDYLGAEDTEITRVFARKFLAAAVARIMRPGIKFDSILLLVGDQNLGKSLIGKKLARDYFDDSLYTVKGKDAMEALRGFWILEMPEMHATRRADLETVKQFISKQKDSYRPAYGRHIKTYARQCVFIGTTNDRAILKDKTGNRRFWTVECKKKKDNTLIENLTNETVDQIWAEAMLIYESGETLWLKGSEYEKAEEQQALYTEDDGLMGTIETFLNKPIPYDWYEKSAEERKLIMAAEEPAPDAGWLRTKVCVLEVWYECLGENSPIIPPWQRAGIRQAIENLGWIKHHIADGRLRFGATYGRQVAYVKEGSKNEK